ncbi:MAG: HEAT repeat domain-containing protein [Acidobacteria bacterium]|nr:HEAT repeat domain-containing protein [Acidobacteriota bacterium]
MKTTLMLLMAALPLPAQPKRLVDARVQTRAVTGGLAQQIGALQTQQPQPAWAAYVVPAARGRQFGCDGYWRDKEFVVAGGVVHLEPPQEVMVLLRFHDQQVSQIRTLAPDCDISAGGATFYWLTGVAAADSVAMLQAFVRPGGRLSEPAVNAIGFHAGPAAEAALEKFIARDQPESVRSRAVSWMGTTRGRRGVEKIKEIVAADPNDRVRRSAINALAASGDAEAVEILVSTAKGDRTASIRSEALRALARKGGPKALAAINAAIEGDPDREVRRNAVAALRSLPDGEGIPQLIAVAKSNRDAEVRKHAMSVLGQSGDPRAAVFFEDVLRAR